MAFEAFGRLKYGSFFRWRDRIWVKVGLSTKDELRFNAYTVDGNKNQVQVELVDEAKLVNINTGIDPKEQEHVIQLHDELWLRNKRAVL